MCNICGHLQLYLEGIDKNATKQCPNCSAGMMSFKPDEYKKKMEPIKEIQEPMMIMP